MAAVGQSPAEPSAPEVAVQSPGGPAADALAPSPRVAIPPATTPVPAPAARGPLSPGREPAQAGAACPVPAAAAPRTPPPLQPCDARGPVDRRRALAYLHLALGREARLWRGGQLQAEICDAFHGLMMWNLENIFQFASTTFHLAFSILVRLLFSAKSIPHIKDFIKHYGSCYSPNELLRMELTILDKLHWDIHIGTPLDFLNIFHTLLVLSWPSLMEQLPQRNPSLHVASLTKQLQHCMAGHQLLQFKGSTLALVTITLELERLMPDWCTPISDLLKKAKISIEEYSHCKKLVQQQLRSL